MDGTAGVTQCPIAPNSSFQYSFSVDVAGTYWYHSHLGKFINVDPRKKINVPQGNQYCDGLRGALIVYDKNDPHKDLYDSEYCLTRCPWLILNQLL